MLAWALAMALSLAVYLEVRLVASATSVLEAVVAKSSVMRDSEIAGGRGVAFLGWRFFLRSLRCPLLPPAFQGPVCFPVQASVSPPTLRSAYEPQVLHHI